MRRIALAMLLPSCWACSGLPLPTLMLIESDDAELRTSGLRMLRDLERLSGLHALAPLRVARLSEDQLRDRMYLSMETSRLELGAAIEAYVMLGLVPEHFDMYTLVRAQSRGITGFYDFETKVLYVLSRVEREAVDMVLAHELVHGIQDQHFDLSAGFAESGGDSDVALAFRAAVEGHASLVMAAWMMERVTGRRVDPASMPSIADVMRRAPVAGGFALSQGPQALHRMFYFPYVEGSSFVRTLWKHYPDDLALALGALRPHSTEQVLNAERALLRGRDEPILLELDAPPPGWTAHYESTMGEFTTRIALEESLGSRAAAAADGWGGDRVRLLDDGADGRLLQWVIVWDDEHRADAFERTARHFIEMRAPRWQGRVARTTINGAPAVQLELADRGTRLGHVPAPSARCRVVQATCGSN